MTAMTRITLIVIIMTDYLNIYKTNPIPRLWLRLETFNVQYASSNHSSYCVILNNKQCNDEATY